MSAIAIIVDGAEAAAWLQRFRAGAPQRDIRAWPHGLGRPEEIAFACVWRAPHGMLARFANLRAIFNLGAGVDHLLADPALPDVPIARAVHPDLTMRMTEYVVLHVLMHHRRQRLYDAQQRACLWQGHPQPAASEVTVGVMGLGALGSEVAAVLRRIGFRVVGWSRSERHLPDVLCFHAADGLHPFLAQTEILACLLPATPATEAILGLDLLRRLRRDGPLGGAYLVNAGRGRLQIDGDILAALDEGSLAGATLDVFPTEPLPADSPLWRHPQVTITPHNAGDLDPAALAAEVLAQIARVEGGLAPQHLVDRALGY